MSKYIDIEKVQHLIVETGNKHSRDGEDIYTCGSVCADLVISVYELPTADVQEVRHGRWVDLQCTVCGKMGWSDEDDYCPNCGSRMDLKGDEDE